ncbi:3-oxoacyl-[acyl-carrier-protein] reductase [Deferribacter desulfuricans SSM1]|uniref:3-oxoacyl-[acyl-carrier-protein] reductase n=1 Tax=Deferribacter desulfuricans (strain DSM 14783 / JCM 11476 / NBRC 101012 / SSM1) TaxID=639282 RepID=D3PC61_DEFDS|nr:SDR family oxidoreductase [Deferribacter desulfuricans]BAI80184.1 3-oxoacyl-[acyl-carrier-protein] reductase [Deferribacter desulfuricans SSM1]
MHLGLENKTVLVMAGTSGLGYAVVLEFAKEGANVVIFGRNEEKFKKASNNIYDITKNKPDYFIGDITNPDDIQLAVNYIVEKYRQIFALFNNTGGPPAGKFEDFNDEDWLNAFNLTLLSYIRTIRAVLPHMKKNGSGRIVNNASSSIKRVIDNLILSNTFRTAIMGLSKSLSRELGIYNILVNTVGAGKISTERVNYLDSIKAKKEGLSLEEFQSKNAKNIPLGRYGNAEEFAKLVVFLCSEANSYITGQSILVDGALTDCY